MTIVMSLIVTKYLAIYPDTGLALAFFTVFLAGIFQICFGLLKLGKYINLMPHAVISGFMTGIGVIIIVLQLPQILGFYDIKGSTLNIFSELGNVGQLFNNFGAIFLSIMTLIIIYLLPKRITRIVPSPLIALTFGTLILLIQIGRASCRERV